MSAPLEIVNVEKAYGRRAVLRSVSFEARPGEILAISGENGAGKSTLLRIAAGLLRPDGGTVRRAGRLGYCDQECQLFPDLTVEEHFAYFARAYGLRNEHWQTVRDGLLDRYGFGRYLAARAQTLSAGTRQKLHLSIALLHRPDLLILDEPHLAFDWKTYVGFLDHADALRRAGVAIVMVSHIVHDRQHVDRVLELREGILECA